MTGPDRPRCVFTFCDRNQGAGTWTAVRGSTKPEPVCEPHWQALRRVRPDMSAYVEPDRPLRCVFTFCDGVQGGGTWTQLADADAPEPVCEPHWQALRRVGWYAPPARAAEASR